MRKEQIFPRKTLAGIEIGHNKVEKETRKNIIFLDIDGVLQPTNFQYRHEHDLEATAAYLAEKYQDDAFVQGDIYDVGAVFYDWHEVAVGRLAYLLRHTDAYLVISSRWREFNSLERFRAFFMLYQLEDYVYDICDPDVREEKQAYLDRTGVYLDEKVIAINRWIAAHQEEIKQYVVIDDYDLSLEFGAHFICTDRMLTDKDLWYTMSVLKMAQRFHPVLSENTYTVGTCTIRYEIQNFGEKKAVFFKMIMTENDSYSYEKDSRFCLLSFLYHFGGLEHNSEDIRYFVWPINEFPRGRKAAEPDSYTLRWWYGHSNKTRFRVKTVPGEKEIRDYDPDYPELCRLADEMWERL